MAIIKPNNNTISAITALPAGVGGKILAAQITTLAPPAADVTTTSTTYAEMNSAMRITHAMSNSSNKLIFTFASTDMYCTGCNGQVGVAKTTDVTTSVIGNQLFLVKQKPSIIASFNLAFEPLNFKPTTTESPFIFSSILKSVLCPSITE